jgi:hypothetical protein
MVNYDELTVINGMIPTGVTSPVILQYIDSREKSEDILNIVFGVLSDKLVLVLVIV